MRVDDLRTDIMQLRRAQLSDRYLITAAEAINDLSTIPIQQSLLPPPSPSGEFVKIRYGSHPHNNAAMRQPRSAERVRPPNIRTMSPTESNTSRESRPFVPSPPLSPLLPQSPTTTFSTISSQASSGETETKHWAGRIFKDLPSTKIVDEKNHKQLYVIQLVSNISSHAPDPNAIRCNITAEAGPTMTNMSGYSRCLFVFPSACSLLNED